MRTKKAWLKANSTYVIVGVLWLVTFVVTGLVYYTSVFGNNSGKIVANAESNSEKEEIVEPVDVMFEKTLIGFGDSIMYGKGTDGYTLAQQIGDKHSMDVYDFSQSGATVTCYDRKKEDIRWNILEQIKEGIAAVDYTDFIIMNGGTNDIVANKSDEFGVITEDFNSTRDVTTFCGALEECFSLLKNSYPNAVIVYVRSHNMKRRSYEKQLIYGEEAKKICQKWGIACADVFSDTDYNTFLEKYRQYTDVTSIYPNGDMVHPTKEGYELFYIPLIEETIEKAVAQKEN